MKIGKKPPVYLLKRMRSDAGKGLSERDELYSLLFADDEWASVWIDALHAIDKERDPQPLIALLASARVPARVMTHLADMLDRKIRPRSGRPASSYKFLASCPAFGATRNQIIGNAQMGEGCMRFPGVIRF